MGVIRVLEAGVANQIAAGEVVERPASVVKELLENALDAGASSVDIALEAGGADLIRVADDGSGMEREDALLAFRRHATSKIRSAADLTAIHSYGFRGEALPSIASVSRMILVTGTGGTRGTRVRLSAGKVLAVEPAAHPRGSTFEVAGLFGNAPARRKFLRSAATETAHVTSIVSRLAVVHPAIALRLTSGGRGLLSLPATGDARARVAQIVGREQAGQFVAVEGVSGGARLTGLASVPALHRSTTGEQHLFVNGRPIRDRRLLHAVQSAYATLLPRGRYPLVYLFLEMPTEEVDVNVHPAKAEVRFLRPGALHDLVRDGLMRGLGTARPFYALHAPAPGVAEPTAGGPAWSMGVGERSDPGTSRDEPRTPGARGGEARAGEARLYDTVSLAPLAQFRDTYILASAPDGLVIVDQHAAHERVLYEKLLARDGTRGAASQRILFPVTIEIGAAEVLAFEEARGALQEIGVEVSPFGDRALIVEAVPSFLPADAVEPLLRDLLREAVDWRRADGIDRLRHRLAATAACHAAVRANHPLDPPRMRALVDDLLATDSPMTCPHGRPVLLRYSVDQIEKEFHRK